MLDDAFVEELAGEPAVTLLCGRYEGFDERIVQHFASDAVSVGRYVLSGGELAAMVVMDAVLRKLPGALGHAESALEESFSQALGGDPEYPHYTRPAEYRGWKVPEVLLSGHHEEIATWRRLRSHERGVVGPTARPPDPEASSNSGRPSGPDPFGPMDEGAAGSGGPDPFGPISR
jgi:tRNA (guanine37-N1)-methyltransferase